MAASNPTAANCSTRLPASTPHRSACAAARFTPPAWVSMTPFGLPVEPEV
ncbi:hypothetical protein LUW74_06075 [Actinomadura madurae]|nr:hypothetical protein [Actinomadura madurae]URN02953.1 hypothetical protein LUW74_06075 [Actinomadura madurae]